MDIRNPVEEAFERELAKIRQFFGKGEEYDRIKERGPMPWETAMERPLIVPIELDSGGEMEIRINHEGNREMESVLR